MQKSIIILALTTFVSGTVVTGHEVTTNKKETGKALHERVSMASPTATSEGDISSAWKDLWKLSEAKFERNENVLYQIKDLYNAEEKAFDVQFISRVNDIENTSETLQSELETYTPVNGDFNSFKIYMDQQLADVTSEINELVLDYRY